MGWYECDSTLVAQIIYESGRDCLNEHYIMSNEKFREGNAESCRLRDRDAFP